MWDGSCGPGKKIGKMNSKSALSALEEEQQDDQRLSQDDFSMWFK